MEILSAGMFKGLVDVSGRMLELYKLRRDGNYFEQQDYLHEIREREAEAAKQRLIESEERTRATRLSESEDIQRNALERDWQQADVQIYSKVTLERLTRQIENSPFSHSYDEFYELAHEASRGGQIPVLLVAPFFREDASRQENDDGPHSFRVAVRRSWMGSPWSGDLGLLDGAISRPLRGTDADLLILRHALRDLPAVVVYGEVQSGVRVWPSLAAWNIADTSSMRSIQVNFPPLSIPVEAVGPDAHPTSRLQFEDELGYSISVTAALIAEWFHLANFGRTPSLHQALPLAMAPERRSIAAGLAAAFEIALERGHVSESVARVNQAVLFGDSNLSSQASRATERALTLIESMAETPTRDTVYQLRQLLLICNVSGDHVLADRTTELLEAVARESLYRDFGWTVR
ncbi:hypothetical protein [Kitasatospora sp. NPDC057015]|uniref:hypothetical protein n=1 Tax=Kitasatospora sp. NPDC057015 TaxID=3346001 RepID=UPI00362B1611